MNKFQNRHEFFTFSWSLNVQKMLEPAGTAKAALGTYNIGMLAVCLSS